MLANNYVLPCRIQAVITRQEFSPQGEMREIGAGVLFNWSWCALVPSPRDNVRGQRMGDLFGPRGRDEIRNSGGPVPLIVEKSQTTPSSTKTDILKMLS